MPKASDIVYAPADTAPASLDALLAVDDLPVLTVYIEGWKQAIRVKAPDLPQLVVIHQQSRKKDPLTGDIIRDRVKYLALALMAIMVDPKLDEAQATLLVRSKNPVVIEAIVDFAINQIPNLAADELAAIVAEAAGVPLDEADDASDPDDNLPV